MRLSSSSNAHSKDRITAAAVADELNRMRGNDQAARLVAGRQRMTLATL
jgi:hypothetical protein